MGMPDAAGIANARRPVARTVVRGRRIPGLASTSAIVTAR